jgi:hypothetical protein
MNDTPTLIGATATVDLPELGIKGLQTRVDTGAATCALHAHSLECKEDESGEEYIEVELFDPDNENYTGEKLIFKDFIVRNVRNSFGTRKKRYMIKTVIVFHHKKYNVLVGFSNRTKLTYDMLLGRNLLKLGFLVDVNH